MSMAILINNWSIVCSDDQPYLAPELRASRLYGDVTNHPKLGNCKGIVTSAIVDVDSEENIITSSGSVYRLGEINPDYDKLFYGAREKLINSLKKLKDNG